LLRRDERLRHCRRRAGESRHQVPQRIRALHHVVGEADTTRVLETQDQLDALETPEAEVAIERVV
jgi:hypothetical protein